MSDIQNLVRDALEHPLIGGAAFLWAASIGLFTYWLNRRDDEKHTSTTTKAVAIISFVLAISTTTLYFWKQSNPSDAQEGVQNKVIHGHEQLKISDVDWNCAPYSDLLIKYNLSEKNEEIRNRADYGDYDYEYLAAMSYALGITMDGNANSDSGKEFDYLSKSAQAGNARSMSALAEYYLRIGDISRSMKWLDEAKNKRLGLAYLLSGQIYDGTFPGKPIPPDGQRAASYYQDAIEYGCIGIAAYRLGLMYYYGGQVGDNNILIPSAPFTKNRTKALDLFRHSAKTDSNDQKYALNYVMKELINSGNYIEASLYIDDAVRICSDFCSLNIANYYYVTENKLEAIKWYQIFIKTNHSDKDKKVVQEVKKILKEIGEN